MIDQQQMVAGVSSADAPAATVNGDTYVIAWTTADQLIQWTSCPATNNQNSYQWAAPAAVPNAGSSGGPALTTFKSLVAMAWKGEGSDTRIFFSTLKGSTWSPGVVVPGAGSNSAPALTATASNLYLFWMGESDKNIHWSTSSDGVTWSAEAEVPGAASTDTPAAAAFNGVVYLGWKGESDNNLLFSRFTEGKGWGTASDLPSPIASSSGPALAVGSTGNLHIVWKGESDTAMWESILLAGQAKWSAQAKILTILTDARPALGSQPPNVVSDILLAWKGASTTNLYVAPLDNLATLQFMPTSAITESSLTWSFPAGATPPASTSGTNNNVGFGSGPTEAAVAASLVLSSDGKIVYTGWYQDNGNVPLVTAGPQTYNAVVVITAANKIAYTFTRSNQNGVATGGTVDTWNLANTSTAIAQNWGNLQPLKGQNASQAAGYFVCKNNASLGDLIDQIVSDIEQVAEVTLEVVAEIAG